MSSVIAQRELRNDNGPIIERVIAGESFVVTRRGRPVADLVPHREGDQTREDGGFVTAEEILRGFTGLQQLDVASWLADSRAADDLIDDDDRDPWQSR